MSRPPRASYALYFIGRLLRALGVLLVFSVCAFLLWRVLFSGRIPKNMRDLQPNAVLHTAYIENGDSLTAFTQEQGSTTRGEKNYGYFSVQRSVILPEAGQIQLVFRYNNSTLRATKEDYQLDAAPERGVPVYDVSLLLLRDLTPEDRTDNTDGSETIAKERILPTSYTVETTMLYTYFLFTFDGVSLTDVPVIYLDVYFPNGAGVDYTAEPYGTLRIYHEESERVPVQLSSGEKKAIAGFTP